MKLTKLSAIAVIPLMLAACEPTPEPSGDEVGETSESETSTTDTTGTDTIAETDATTDEDESDASDDSVDGVDWLEPGCPWPEVGEDQVCLGNAGFLYTGIPPTSVLAGDVDGDGLTDVIASGPSTNVLQVALGQGGGVFTDTWLPSALSQGIRGLALGDIDGDELPDLVLANIFAPSGTGVAFGDGTGMFSPPLYKPTGTTPRAVALADLDDDGWLDALVAEEDGGQVFVLLNDGAGVLEVAGSFAVGSEPYDVVAIDLDGDDIEDLATANRGDDSITVLWGDGAGSFADPLTAAAGLGPRGLVAVDLDGDGDHELISADFDGNTVTLLRNRSEVEPRSFDPLESTAVGGQPYAVAAGDVDGDGAPEVLSADSGTGTVSVLRNVGGVLEAGYGSVVVGSQPFDLALAHLDGDAGIDVLSADFGSSSISILLTGG